jgi:hypothetical protein
MIHLFSFHLKTIINFLLLSNFTELTVDFHDEFQIWVRFIYLKPAVMNKIYTTVLSTLIFSCGTKLNYLGTSLSPTTKVDVYVDASAIKRPYTIIGKGYQESSLVSKERMQQQAIMKAKEKGADAVLFEDYFVTRNETNAYLLSKADSSANTFSMHNRSASAVLNSEVSILFLKYNRAGQ